MNRTWKWLAVAGCVVVLGSVAGRIHYARAAEEGQPYERAPAGDDAASRLDRIIEKLDRVVDRMHAERMGPPGRPPQRGREDHGGPRGPGEEGRREYGEQAEAKSGQILRNTTVMLVGFVNGTEDLQECDVPFPKVSEMGCCFSAAWYHLADAALFSRPCLYCTSLWRIAHRPRTTNPVLCRPA